MVLSDVVESGQKDNSWIWIGNGRRVCYDCYAVRRELAHGNYSGERSLSQLQVRVVFTGCRDVATSRPIAPQIEEIQTVRDLHDNRSVSQTTTTVLA